MAPRDQQWCRRAGDFGECARQADVRARRWVVRARCRRRGGATEDVGRFDPPGLTDCRPCRLRASDGTLQVNAAVRPGGIVMPPILQQDLFEVATVPDQCPVVVMPGCHRRHVRQEPEAQTAYTLSVMRNIWALVAAVDAAITSEVTVPSRLLACRLNVRSPGGPLRVRVGVCTVLVFHGRLAPGAAAGSSPAAAARGSQVAASSVSRRGTRTGHLVPGRTVPPRLGPGRRIGGRPRRPPADHPRPDRDPGGPGSRVRSDREPRPSRWRSARS